MYVYFGIKLMMYYCLHIVASAQPSLQLVPLEQKWYGCVDVHVCCSLVPFLSLSASDHSCILPGALCSADAQLLGDGAREASHLQGHSGRTGGDAKEW